MGSLSLERRLVGQRLGKEERRRRQDLFLEVFSRTGIVLRGCEAANVSRQLIDYWNEHDEQFRVRYGIAKAEANDRIRAEIHRRAIEGVRRTKGVYHNGRLVATEEITEYSDTLLIFLAKARMPEEFREKYQVTGPDGGPIQIEDARERLLGRLLKVPAEEAAGAGDPAADPDRRPGDPV